MEEAAPLQSAYFDAFVAQCSISVSEWALGEFALEGDLLEFGVEFLWESAHSASELLVGAQVGEQQEPPGVYSHYERLFVLTGFLCVFFGRPFCVMIRRNDIDQVPRVAQEEA